MEKRSTAIKVSILWDLEVNLKKDVGTKSILATYVREWGNFYNSGCWCNGTSANILDAE